MLKTIPDWLPDAYQQAQLVILNRLREDDRYGPLVEHLIKNRKLKTGDVKKLLNCSYPTARKHLIYLMRLLGLQPKLTSGRKYRYYTIKLTEVCGGHNTKLYHYFTGRQTRIPHILVRNLK